MTKTFDYNIGDEVWIMKDNKARKCTITGMHYADYISIVGFGRHSEERYTLSIGDEELRYDFRPGEFYRTKEDLFYFL